MDAPLLVEAIHVGWAYIMDDVLPFYQVINDNTNVDGTAFEAGEDSPRPTFEAPCFIEGVHVGSARVMDDVYPVYQVMEKDDTVPEAKYDCAVPAIIPANGDNGIPPSAYDTHNHLEAHEVNLDSLEERILQALGGLEMMTIREAYLEASGLHAQTTGAHPSLDGILVGNIHRVTNYCGEVLESFKSRVLGGIEHGLVPIMLAELKTVVDLLKAIFRAKDQALNQTSGDATPNSTLRTGITHEEHSNRLDNNNIERGAPKANSQEEYNQTLHLSQGQHQILHLNPGAPLELDAEPENIVTTNSHEDVDHHENVHVDVETDIEGNGWDQSSWGWIDQAECEDNGQVTDWVLV